MADREREPSDTPDSRNLDEAETDALESLRAAVEEKYDFENFRPADMAEMSVEEWEVAFDPETWITGERLVDRVEAELRARVADGELFAVVERHAVDGDLTLLVYTDAEYVLVRSDGSITGEGAIRREVEPVVALCSMESFEVAEPPADAGLPDPSSVRSGSGDLGHRLLLAVAAILAIAGLVLFGAPVLVRLGPGAGALTTVIGFIFLGVGVLLGVLVANARLSDRFRSAEYRERLEAAGVGSDERPSFLPPMEVAEEESAPPESDGL